MTCEVTVRDERSVARIINLAHRFTCRTLRIDAVASDDGTAAHFAFAGPPAALARLRAQIDRLIAAEGADPLRLRLRLDAPPNEPASP